MLPRKCRGRIPLGWSLLFLLLTSLASLSFPVHAAASADLAIESIWLEDASQIGQPVSQLSPGQSFNIVATIKNIGQDAASDYYLDVYYDSDYGRGGPDNIAAGEVQTWYVGPLTAQTGAHTAKWVLDPDDQIAELDETNNQKELVFTAGSQTATTTMTSSLTSSTTELRSTSTSYTTESTSTEVTSTTTATMTSTSTSSTIIAGSIVSVSDSPDPAARRLTANFSVTVKNTGNIVWSSATVTIKIYRPDGSLVATPAAKVKGIQPGGQYTCKISWRVPYNARRGIWHYEVYVNYAGVLIASSTDPASTITVK